MYKNTRKTKKGGFKYSKNRKTAKNVCKISSFEEVFKNLLREYKQRGGGVKSNSNSSQSIYITPKNTSEMLKKSSAKTKTLSAKTKTSSAKTKTLSSKRKSPEPQLKDDVSFLVNTYARQNGVILDVKEKKVLQEIEKLQLLANCSKPATNSKSVFKQLYDALDEFLGNATLDSTTQTSVKILKTDLAKFENSIQNGEFNEFEYLLMLNYWISRLLSTIVIVFNFALTGGKSGMKENMDNSVVSLIYNLLQTTSLFMKFILGTKFGWLMVIVTIVYFKGSAILSFLMTLLWNTLNEFVDKNKEMILSFMKQNLYKMLNYFSDDIIEYASDVASKILTDNYEVIESYAKQAMLETGKEIALETAKHEARAQAEKYLVTKALEYFAIKGPELLLTYVQ
jgi:hypothetical protein